MINTKRQPLRVKNPQYVIAFGAHVQQLRKERNLSQQALADMADLPKKTIQRIELAKHVASIDICVSIAIALEIDLWTLFKFETP